MHRKPSPALVISIISLIVALGGTAVAASHYLITSSAQVRNGSLRGVDIRNHSISGTKIKDGTLPSSAFAKGVAATSQSGGAHVLEAYRKLGPTVPNGGKATVANLTLQPGAYIVTAKANVVPDHADANLLEALGADHAVVAGCHINIDGDGDYGAGTIQGVGSQTPVDLYMQVTRTIDHVATAELTCETGRNFPWHAGDASIIALPVASAPRTESTP